MHKFVPWLLIGVIFCSGAATRRPYHDDLGVIMYTGELIISIIALIFFAMIFIKD